MLPVSAEVRAGAGIAAGDEIEIELTPDTAPREVTIPDDLLAAFANDDLARQIFDKLSYSNKQRLVLSIEGAKTAETRERRVAKTISQLREGKI
jgi:uncharacterized protein YdeI (YjbR/CyaY-like superfamily)